MSADAADDGPDQTDVGDDVGAGAEEADADATAIDPNALAIEGEDISWFPCGAVTQCATVDVPIDYDNPDAGALAISISVRRSTDPDARVGYLFVNPGGPGVSGVDLVVDADLIGFPEELLDCLLYTSPSPRDS